MKTSRYWVNENLLKLTIEQQEINLAEAIKKIIDAYIAARSEAFNDFITYCQQMIEIQAQEPDRAIEFIRGLLRPNIDARIFEIVSYAVLKQYYAGQQIYWGWSPDDLTVESLSLYKTGRTNANDGGIDFVMKPLGRFFQVTETIDAGKYFLDIDKVQKYPTTFVVKTEEKINSILQAIEAQAKARYKVKAVVDSYMKAVEEVINIPKIMECFDAVLQAGRGAKVIDEIVLQSRLEFNVDGEDEDAVVEEDLSS
ncbi:hypothetical protein [[Phormidium] sp. ETS-05]|uniref:hypothetical protein n=1 Tax=[Phormidium] sp. ETS-05 TaxID=222819 RepID=UPI001E34D015|nr:hypothetical protein [[Phormidium] sp. ETS-05]